MQKLSGKYVFAWNRDTAAPVEGNGDLQTLICVLAARPRRCPTLWNTVLWQSWMAAYPGYTLQMKTLFLGWSIMVHDTHTRKKEKSNTWHIIRQFRDKTQSAADSRTKSIIFKGCLQSYMSICLCVCMSVRTCRQTSAPTAALRLCLPGLMDQTLLWQDTYICLFFSNKQVRKTESQSPKLGDVNTTCI